MRGCFCPDLLSVFIVHMMHTTVNCGIYSKLTPSSGNDNVLLNETVLGNATSKATSVNTTSNNTTYNTTSNRTTFNTTFNSATYEPVSKTKTSKSNCSGTATTTESVWTNYDQTGAMKFIIVTVAVYSMVGTLSLLLTRVCRRARTSQNRSDRCDEMVDTYLRIYPELRAQGDRDRMLSETRRMCVTLTSVEEETSLCASTNSLNVNDKQVVLAHTVHDGSTSLLSKGDNSKITDCITKSSPVVIEMGALSVPPNYVEIDDANRTKRTLGHTQLFNETESQTQDTQLVDYSEKHEAGVSDV